MKTLTLAGSISRLGAAVAFSVVLSGAATVAIAQPKPGGTPLGQSAGATKVLVIDRNAILLASKVGKDIVRQVNGYRQSAEKEFRAEGQSLQKEGQALRQQIAILAPDVKNKKIKDFQAKQNAFERKVESRQGLIQGGVFQARKQVEAALGPILQGIMQERGANLLLDRSAVVLGSNSMDITPLAVQRLDKKLPAVKVQLTALPAGVQQQMQQQAMQR
jgi:outer membrane protein